MRRGLIIAAVVVVVLLVGVRFFDLSGGGRRLPPPSSTSSTSTTTTSVPDFSGVNLAGVPGTTTTLLTEVGNSTIRGNVTTSSGGVVDATVRLERLVLGTIQIRDVKTDGSGSFTAGKVPGGAYRVRAFLPPSVAQLEPIVFRLTAGETRDLELKAESFAGTDVASVISPSTPWVDELVNVRVRVSERMVGDDGVVRGTPLAGLSVTLRSTTWMPLDPTGFQLITDQQGQVLFELRCLQTGPPRLSVDVEGLEGAVSLEAPNCTDRPAPTTATSDTTEPSDDSSSSSSTASTTTTL